MNKNDDLTIKNIKVFGRLIEHLSCRFKEGDYCISNTTTNLLHTAFNWSRFEKNEEYPVGGIPGKAVYEHTLDVMKACMAISSRQTSAYPDFSCQNATLEEILRLVQNIYLDEHEKEILGHCALFHDIGNTRITSGHEAESGKLLEEFYVRLPEDVLAQEKRDDILWLVSRHTFMGGALYYGELSPGRILDKAFSDLPVDTQKRRLKLLSLFGLCDLMGTRKGAFVQIEKAKYIASRSLEALQKDMQKLFERRVEQFNGEPTIDGTPNKWKSYIFYEYFESAESAIQDVVKCWFGEKIVEIQGAIGHFIFMGPKNVAKMMVLVSETLEILRKKELKLNTQIIGFETPSSSPSAVLPLLSYWRDVVFYQLDLSEISKQAKVKAASFDLNNRINVGGVILGNAEGKLTIFTGRV